MCFLFHLETRVAQIKHDKPVNSPVAHPDARVHHKSNKCASDLVWGK